MNLEGQRLCLAVDSGRVRYWKKDVSSDSKSAALDSREMLLLDNNVPASDHGLEQVDRMGYEEVWVDFNQGLGAWIITQEITGMPARLHWIRFPTSALRRYAQG